MELQQLIDETLENILDRECAANDFAPAPIELDEMMILLRYQPRSLDNLTELSNLDNIAQEQFTDRTRREYFKILGIGNCTYRSCFNALNILSSREAKECPGDGDAGQTLCNMERKIADEILKVVPQAGEYLFKKNGIPEWLQDEEQTDNDELYQDAVIAFIMQKQKSEH